MRKLIMIALGAFLLGMNLTYAKETVNFSKCVDGDTIKVLLEGKEYTVRMLAIDTPESVHPTKGEEYYGKEASDYTCNKVKNAKKLELEYDENSSKFDKYDRLLAWVITDDILLQKDLVANGYAKVAYLYGDYKYTDELQKSQELASAKNLGIWNEEAKENYEKKAQTKNATSENNTKNTAPEKEYQLKDIAVIALLLLTILFVGDKTIKSNAKKKLKKYLR